MDVYRITFKSFATSHERLNGKIARELMDSRGLTDITAFLKAFDAACAAAGVANPWGLDVPGIPTHGMGYTMAHDGKNYVPYTAAFFLAVMCSHDVAQLIQRMPQVASVTPVRALRGAINGSCPLAKGGFFTCSGLASCGRTGRITGHFQESIPHADRQPDSSFIFELL